MREDGGESVKEEGREKRLEGLRERDLGWRGVSI